MTDATVHCDRCESIVEVVRQADRKLVLRCDCPERRGVKMARALPEGWSA